GERSGTPTEPHHIPSLEATSSQHTTSSILLPSILTAPIPTVTQTDTTPIIQYSRRSRIAQSSALPTVADEPTSPVRDDSQGEACPTDSSFIADQDRATIAKGGDPMKGRQLLKKISTDSEEIARVLTSLDEATVLAGETNVPTGSGSIPTAGPPATIVSTGSEVGPTASPIVPIKGRSTNEGEAPAERISIDLEEIARVLTSMDAATALAGETNVPTGSGSIPTAGPPATIVSTGSEVGPTASPIVRRRKGKEILVESDTPKKKKLQE
nr:hypothetical protein [Tanacetum cinerariifolium]